MNLHEFLEENTIIMKGIIPNFNIRFMRLHFYYMIYEISSLEPYLNSDFRKLEIIL